MCVQCTDDTFSFSLYKIMKTIVLGRLSVLSTQTNNTITSINMKEIPDINLANFKDLSPIG